jgi:hypothetical protein
MEQVALRLEAVVMVVVDMDSDGMFPGVLDNCLMMCR